MSEKQAQLLDVKAYTRWRPYLEKCCLVLSANESYERAAEDIEVLTGVKILLANSKNSQKATYSQIELTRSDSLANVIFLWDSIIEQG